MIKLTAATRISDELLLHAISAKHLKERITDGLARSFAISLMEQKEYQESIVKRESAIFTHETTYETSMYLISHAEAKEFKELREFKQQMQRFVK